MAERGASGQIQNVVVNSGKFQKLSFISAENGPEEVLQKTLGRFVKTFIPGEL